MLLPRTAEGRAGLEALRADPRGALLALDYDGTLAPVVEDPVKARPAAGAVEELVRLAGLGARVVVVTGRPAAVAVGLGGLEQVPGLLVLGQYGAERWQGGQLVTPEPVDGIDPARTALPPLVGPVGGVVEDKRLSLVVHTRTAPDPVGALEALAAPLLALARDCGLELHRGRLVLELRPPGFDKRAALLAAAGPGPTGVLYAGDDVGDGPAYDAVEVLRGRGVPALTVFSDSPEGPREVRDRADLVVEGPSGVVALLGSLARPA